MAVFTLRLAIQCSGYRSDYTLFPEPDEPDLVARVTATWPSAVTPAAEAVSRTSNCAGAPDTATSSPAGPAIIHETTVSLRRRPARGTRWNPYRCAEASAQQRTGETFEPYPTILVLATEGDRRVDWARAGQALQLVLLTTTWQDLATTPISQPVEMPVVRSLLIRARIRTGCADGGVGRLRA